MKIKDIKHDHSLTDLLKVLLFSILMLAPILAIGVKCGYVMLNKNAKDSYYGETINEKTSTLVDNTNLKTNETYTLMAYNNNQFTDSYGTSNYIAVDNVRDLNNFTEDDISSCNRIQFYTTSTNKTIFFRYNDTELTRVFINTTEVVVNFTFLSYGPSFQTGVLSYWDFFYDVQYNKDSYLDNVFYYAIDEVAQEPLFNWTQNTAIYTGVNAMCTGMEITSPIIPILITYWFLLTCIYVIIDILIKGFTMLTHLIGSKLA